MLWDNTFLGFSFGRSNPKIGACGNWIVGREMCCDDYFHVCIGIGPPPLDRFMRRLRSEHRYCQSFRVRSAMPTALLVCVDRSGEFVDASGISGSFEWWVTGFAALLWWEMRLQGRSPFAGVSRKWCR